MNEVPHTLSQPRESVDKPPKVDYLKELEGHRHYIINVIHRINNYPTDLDAEEMAQKVIYKAVEAISSGKFRGETDIKTWLFAITQNLIFSESRTKKRQREKGLVDEIPKGMEAKDHNLNPQEQTIQNDTENRLWKAVQSLPDEQRIVISLRLADRSFKEIANLLGIPETTARTRDRNARMKLKEKLKEN